MTSEKNFVPLIKQALTNIIGTIEFKKTNSTALLSLRILSSAILALCRDAFSLLENNRIFTACSLVCQATEAQIQLLCIDKLYDTKGRDYYEFAFIEQLKSLPINPHWQEKTLQRMHYYNCERFYNGKGKNTADFNSYNKNWYKSFANSIKDLSKIAFPHFKELFHNQGTSSEYPILARLVIDSYNYKPITEIITEGDIRIRNRANNGEEGKAPSYWIAVRSNLYVTAQYLYIKKVTFGSLFL